MDQPSPTRDWRQGGGERGRLGPKDRIPYRTANRSLVSNQRPPEILDGRHPPGGSRRDTRCRHPTCAGGDWGWGRGRQKAPRTPGERAREAPGCLSVSDGEGTKCRRSFLFRLLWNTGGLEPRAAAGHAPYRTAGSLSSVAGESSTSPSPQRDGTSNLNKSPPPPACVRAEIWH